MSIIKNENTISEIIINNANISEIYYGNTLVHSSSIKIPKIVFRDIDENGNLTAATGDLIGLFDEIKTISSSGLYYAFYDCTGITGSISFPALTTIDSYSLYYAFGRCTGITSVSFPALISVGNSGLQHAFYGCTGITSIHFRADAKSIIEAADGYSSKFDASNATIYFDL